MRRFAAFFLNHLPRPLLLKLSVLLRPLLVLFYRGNTFTDPIDGRSYRKFLPYGYGKQRENALSPGTLSLERHRQMWLYLQRETDFFTSEYKVLHIAPEQEFLRRFRQMPNLEYLTADLYSPLVDVKADLTKLPFEDCSFDVVFCNHVLEHIEEDMAAMRELHRVLRKGGWGIVQVPLSQSAERTYEDFTIRDPKMRQQQFGQYDHVRLYGMDYFDRLQTAGFEVEKNFYSINFSAADRTRFGLLENEILPVIFKN